MSSFSSIRLVSGHSTVLSDKYSGSAELDLSKQYLHTVPDWVREHSATIRVLKLRGNLIQHLPAWLSEFNHLTELDVSNNGLRGEEPFSVLSQLKSLTSLNLSGNQAIRLPDSLSTLSRLKSLNVINCPTPSLPGWITGNGSLRTLRVGGLLNQDMRLDELPAGLSDLSMTSMSLQDLPASVVLLNLKRLDVSGNRLTAWGVLQTMGQLAVLAAARNSLTEELDFTFAALRYLNVQENGLRSLSSICRHAPSLRVLIASGNKIREIPASIQYCTHLERLQLAHNDIRSVITGGIERLEKLEEVDLSSNVMSEWPTAFARLPELVRFRFDGNLVREVPHDALAYLRAIAQRTVSLKEAKLVLVGDGMVGKSSLLAALAGDQFDPDRPTTHGLETRELLITDSDGKAQGKLQCWDFGGQTQYQSSHQIFFSEDAIYLLLWRPRNGFEECHLTDWAEQVRQRAGLNARLVVVATHRDLDTNPAILDRRRLLQEYGINDFFHIGSESGEGVADLRSFLAGTIREPFYQHELPEAWLEVRDALRKVGRPYLALREAILLARHCGVGSASCGELLRLGHRLGWWIFYADAEALSEYVVLKGDWLSKAIGLVFDSDLPYENLGMVTSEELTSIWDNSENPDSRRYPVKLHRHFIALMERFDISFRVPDRPGYVSRYILPELLPNNLPDAMDAWKRGVAGDLSDSRYCQMTLEVNGQVTVPKNFMPRFIARVHWLALDPAALSTARCRHSVVLADDNSRASVSQGSDGVLIKTYGRDPSAFAVLVADHVKNVLADYWPGVQLTEYFPCPRCEEIKGFERPALLERLARGIREAECPHCFARLPVSQVMNKISSQQDVALASLVDELSRLRETVENAATASREAQAEIGASLIAMHGYLKSDLQILLAGFRDEALNGPRLFTIAPVGRSPAHLNLTHTTIRVELYCEHCNQPVHMLDNVADSGVYEFEVPREMWVKIQPWASRIAKLVKLASPLDLGALFGSDSGGELLRDLAGAADEVVLELTAGADAGFIAHESGSELITRSGSGLRKIQKLMRESDPGFADLRLVHNGKRHIWVHRDHQHLYH